MAKQISRHAAVAKAIRDQLAAHNIPGRVVSTRYAGGSSVRVMLDSPTPWTVKAVEAFAGQFQYGHFDGMRDCYEASNVRADIPQVSYVFVEQRFTDADKQRAWDYLRENFSGFDLAPALYAEGGYSFRPAGRGFDGSAMVWQVLNGSTYRNSNKFWQKPRVRLAA